MTPKPIFGVQLHPDHTTWEALRDAGLLVDQLGFDVLMTWDHFIPLRGDTTGPNFEGWQVLAAWGALTRRAKIGMLVTGNTYRHPALLAKMVATLDHITGGRAILGIGAAWNETEHRMYGIPLDTAGVRLAKLDEAVQIIRSLLTNERTTFQGKYYTITDARAEPKPLQPRLPILIGGGGERKTLRTTARYADMWHGFGGPEEIAHKIEVLRAHCADAGRDPREILITSGFQPSIVLRDDPKQVDEWRWTVARAAGGKALPPGRPLHTVDAVVARLLEYWKAGVRGFLIGFSPPFDRETLERLANEVRPKFEAALGTDEALEGGAVEVSRTR